MRFTVAKIPNSQNNAQATKLPLGLIIQPMALDCKGEESIDVINFGSTGIVRCKKCRTYINPFVSWLDNGRRWRCNVCGTVNDVPSAYFQHLDANGQR
jgi:protein transport protein SEC24